jgi:L-ribulose-5-phosphate 4-epimerase
MLENIKKQVFEANLRLVREGLVILTFGNASAIDRENGLVVIKPSGVDYAEMSAEQMVTVDLETGETIEGTLKPSSDTPTHLELYRNFPDIGGIVHTHSKYATIWSQANREIPCFGTTHADYFYGNIPCTRAMTDAEINENYELNTGKVIVERFTDINPNDIPAVLVANHAPFVWGKSVKKAVENSIVLEYIAELTLQTTAINSDANAITQTLLDKHFLRKHGKNAYYGQS